MHGHEAAKEQRIRLLKHPQVRGLSPCGESVDALRAMAAGREVVLPMFWGFRMLDADGALHDAERHTMQAFVELVASFGKHCQPVLILADEHAEHNGIDAAIWRPYYAAVQVRANELGLQVRYLSDIFRTLKLSRAKLAHRGSTLVERPSGQASFEAVILNGNEWSQLKRHSQHLCERFPSVFAAPRGESAKRKLYDPRALAYARFRAAEGRLLLPRLHEAFGDRPVLPVHVTGPESGRFGVRGLSIHAKDANDDYTVHIPWK